MRFPVAPYPHQHLVVVVSVFWILTILIGVLCISLLFYKNILILFSINILFFSQGMACFFLFSCRLFYCFHLSKVISLFDYWFCWQVFLYFLSYVLEIWFVCSFLVENYFPLPFPSSPFPFSFCLPTPLLSGDLIFCWLAFVSLSPEPTKILALWAPSSQWQSRSHQHVC